MYLTWVKPIAVHKATGAVTAAQDNTRAFGLLALKAAAALQAAHRLVHPAVLLARRLRALLAARHRLALLAAEAVMAYKHGAAARFIPVVNKRSKMA